jgi:hypothetical protein
MLGSRFAYCTYCCHHVDRCKSIKCSIHAVMFQLLNVCLITVPTTENNLIVVPMRVSVFSNISVYPRRVAYGNDCTGPVGGGSRHHITGDPRAIHIRMELPPGVKHYYHRHHYQPSSSSKGLKILKNTLNHLKKLRNVYPLL